MSTFVRSLSPLPTRRAQCGKSTSPCFLYLSTVKYKVKDKNGIVLEYTSGSTLQCTSHLSTVNWFRGREAGDYLSWA